MSSHNGSNGDASANRLRRELTALFNAQAETLKQYASGLIPQSIQHLYSPEDIVQDVYTDLCATNRFAELSTPGALDKWLRKAIVFKTSHLARRLKTAKRSEDNRVRISGSTFVKLCREQSNGYRSPSSIVSMQERANDLCSAMKMLPTEDRKIMDLHLKDVPNEEVAKKTRLSLRAIAGRLFRIKAKLRGHGKLRRHSGD